MSKFSKFLLTLLSFLTIFSSSLSFFAVPKVSAQNTNPWYMQTFNQWYVKVYDTNTSPPQEIFGERYTAAQVQWVMYGILSFFLNSNRLTQIYTCVFQRTDVDSCLNQTPLFASNTEPAVLANKTPFEAMFPKERTLSAVNYVRS